MASILAFLIIHPPLISGLILPNIKWKLPPLSVIGHVNIINKITLSKCIYLFQIPIPIFLMSSLFRTIDPIVMPFINKPQLQKATAEGGLGLPLFQHYYWSFNARAWIFWNHVPAVGVQRSTLRPR